MNKEINIEAITLQDCFDNYDKRNRITVVENGQVSDIVKE